MNIHQIKTTAEHFLSENASTILTVSGVVGTVSTAVLSVRAGYKSSEILTQAKLERTIEGTAGTDEEPEPLTKLEKTRLIAPQFLPPVVVGGATVASIIMANRINAQRAAALIAAYGLADKRLEDYKAKVSEKLTGPKKQAIEDEIAQDGVVANPPTDKEVIIIADGDVLMKDAITGRYFQSTVDKVQRAMTKINAQLFEEGAASLSDFYNEIDLAPTGFTDLMGWNGLNGGVLEIKMHTTVTENQKPCIVIDFSRTPMPGFTKTWMD